jgi:predicted transport protein
MEITHMPIYHLADEVVQQLKPTKFRSERALQKLFESNLEVLLGVRYIASEFTTGDRQRGRIDSLGLDQDGTPTIIEYKKTSKENVINQGLYYLDWLVDHKGDFTIAVQKSIGSSVKIDWSTPRLILIAEEFTEYDKYAVNRIGANIELWVYRLYSDGILYLDPIFVPDVARKKPSKPISTETSVPEGEAKEDIQYELDWHLEGKPEIIQETFSILREKLLGFGEVDEITENVTKIYIGYRHGKNFCEVQPLKSYIKIWVDISPDELEDPLNYGRDVRNIGHHGTGQVELLLSTPDNLEYVVGLIKQSYHLTV